MRTITLNITALLILFSLTANAKKKAPQNGIGGSLIYNFQTKAIGLGLRAEFPLERINLMDGVSVVPQVSYMPWFNDVSEFYIGTSVHLGLITLKNKWKPYGLVNLSYNGWINYKDSDSRKARFSNPGIEIGLGITTNRCTRPFLEVRYNAWWKEATIQLGFVYTLKCDKRGSLPCPKIPPPPKL